MILHDSLDYRLITKTMKMMSLLFLTLLQNTMKSKSTLDRPCLFNCFTEELHVPKECSNSKAIVMYDHFCGRCIGTYDNSFDIVIILLRTLVKGMGMQSRKVQKM